MHSLHLFLYKKIELFTPIAKLFTPTASQTPIASQKVVSSVKPGECNAKRL